MDKLLETYNLQRLNQKKIKYLTSNKTESLIKKIPTKKNLGLGIPPNITGKVNTYGSQTIKKIRGWKHLKTHSTRSALLWYQNQTKTLQKRENIPDEHRCKNPQQNISKLNSTIYKKHHTSWPSVIYSRDVRMVQYWNSTCEYWTINKTKDKNHIVFSIDTENAFDKIQHPFMIKTLNKVG